MPYYEGSIEAMKNIILFTFIGVLFLGFSNVGNLTDTNGLGLNHYDAVQLAAEDCPVEAITIE